MREVRFVFLPWDELQAGCAPFDKRLPKSAKHDQYQAELSEIQSRFRAAIGSDVAEGDDWEFPSYYQDVRVFYIYGNTSKLYTPTLPDAVIEAMDGYESEWIAELECFDPPGKPGGVTFLAYHNREFWLSDTPASVALASQLRPPT